MLKIMNIHKIIFGLSLLIFGHTGLFAQQSYSLQQCRDTALALNKTLKNSGFQIDEAQANKKAAFTNFLPTFEANASTLIVPDMENIGMSGGFLPTANSLEEAQQGIYSGTSNVYSPGFSLDMDELIYSTADITVSQAVYAGGKIRNSNKIYDKALEISQENYTLNKNLIIEDIDRAYWTAVAVKESHKLANAYIKLLSELEEQLTDSYELGLTPRSDLLQVRVQKNEAQLNEIKVRNGLKLAKMQICQIMGINIQTKIVLTDTILSQSIMPDTLASIPKALGQRQELSILSRQIEISELQRKIVQADFLPQIGVGASYSYAHVNDLIDGSWNSMISGQINIPIFHWRESKHKIKAARLKSQQVEMQKADASDLISLEVSRSITLLEESLEAINLSHKSLAEAEESLEETQIGYDAGLNTITQVLDAQASWQNAKTNLIRSLANFEIAKASYKRSIGL